MTSLPIGEWSCPRTTSCWPQARLLSRSPIPTCALRACTIGDTAWSSGGCSVWMQPMVDSTAAARSAASARDIAREYSPSRTRARTSRAGGVRNAALCGCVGPLSVPLHARPRVPPSCAPDHGSTHFRSGPATPWVVQDDSWLFEYVLAESVSTVPASSCTPVVLSSGFRVARSDPCAPAPSHHHPLP